MFKSKSIPYEKRREVRYKIALWELSDQQEYADAVCVELVKNKHDFLKENYEHNLNDEFFNEWNATSVGNCAYIALNSSNPKEKEFYKNLLKEYKEWVVEKKLA